MFSSFKYCLVSVALGCLWAVSGQAAFVQVENAVKGVTIDNLEFLGNCASNIAKASIHYDESKNPVFQIYFKKDWGVVRTKEQSSDGSNASLDVCTMLFTAKADAGTSFRFVSTIINGQYRIYYGHRAIFRASGDMAGRTIRTSTWENTPRTEKEKLLFGSMDYVPLPFINRNVEFPCGKEFNGSMQYTLTIEDIDGRKPLGTTKISLRSISSSSTSGMIEMPLDIKKCSE